jgi:hypothetical protein
MLVKIVIKKIKTKFDTKEIWQSTLVLRESLGGNWGEEREKRDEKKIVRQNQSKAPPSTCVTHGGRLR